MKLLALRLFNVRRFADRGVALEGIGAGVNVLCARNEFGKSTSFDALHALFFQPHSGTPGPVQALRPYSGGSPRVEADIETAAGRFRIAKRYYGGRAASVTDLASGRLIAQADEAERFIADQVHAGAGGPAGLLWVRQGVTGIDRRAKTDEEAEKRARESVLTSVQGEVEALTGGRRMAEIAAACEDELAKYVSPAGRDKRGRYAEVFAECKTLGERVDKLSTEVEQLRGALDERRRVRSRLAELGDTEESARRERDLAAAETALEAARAHGEKLQLAQTRAHLARERLERAHDELAAFEALVERDAALGAEAARIEAARREARTRLDAQAAGVARTEAELAAAETAEREALDLFMRLERALRARVAAEKRQAHADTLANAERTRAEIEDIEARLAPLALLLEKLDALEKAEAELEADRIRAAARAPALTVSYAPNAAGSISIAGAPLTEGETRTLPNTTMIAIEGVGHLSLVAQASEGFEKREARLARRDALLAEMTIDSLAEARDRAESARTLRADLARARDRLALYAPQGIAALKEALVAAGEEAVAQELPDGDPESLRLAHEALERKRTDLRNRLRAETAQRETLSGALVVIETDAAGIERARSDANRTLGPEPDRAARLARLRNTRDEAIGPHDDARTHYEAIHATAPDLAAAQARVDRLRSARDSTGSEIARLRESLAGLDGKIAARADDAVEEAWREAVEALARAEAERDRIAHEVLVLTLLRDTLASARSEAREHYFEPVMRELRPLLSLLFDGADVAFDETSLLPRAVVRNGQTEEIDRLSGGMREQLAVMTRLAFARLLARDGRPAPVILDDALVYSDDDRIEKMFDALHRQARDQQIIVFSCRQRAFASLGGNVLTMTDWSPRD